MNKYLRVIILYTIMNSCSVSQNLIHHNETWVPKLYIDSAAIGNNDLKFLIPIQSLTCQDGITYALTFKSEYFPLKLDNDGKKYKIVGLQFVADSSLDKYRDKVFYLSKLNENLLLEIKSSKITDSVVFVSKYLENPIDDLLLTSTKLLLQNGSYGLFDSDSIQIGFLKFNFNGEIAGSQLFMRYSIEASGITEKLSYDSSKILNRKPTHKGYTIIRLFSQSAHHDYAMSGERPYATFYLFEYENIPKDWHIRTKNLKYILNKITPK